MARESAICRANMRVEFIGTGARFRGTKIFRVDRLIRGGGSLAFVAGSEPGSRRSVRSSPEGKVV